MASDMDEDNVLGGDLGLGMGLKPGGLPLSDTDDDSDEINIDGLRIRKSRSLGDNPVNNKPLIGHRTYSLNGRHLARNHRKNTIQTKRKEPSAKSDSDISKSNTHNRNHGNGNNKVDYPQFAQIPLGTSIRQQKEIFQHELHELFHHGSSSDTSEIEEPVNNKEKKPSNKLATLFMKRRLKKTEMELEILRQDLDLCQKQLEAKYKAIRILQKQQFSLHSAHIDTTRKAKELHKALTQEINALQFELEHSQSILVNSQALWAERFDRSCRENSALMATLEQRDEEVRKIRNDKMSLTRERDELLASLDIQERQKYESTRSPSTEGSEEAYNSFSTTELAVLGACTCRVKDPDPCLCAHAAANLKKDVCRLREELEHEKQLKEEALVTTDAYRIAFEEQLSRNRSLMRQIADLTTLNSVTKTSKAKAAIKWLIQQLNEDVPSRPRPRPAPSTTPEEGENKALPAPEPDDGLQNMTEQELVHMLLEMINDRSEALAHQRLAARMLASRTKELEEKLNNVTGEVFENGKT